RRVRRSAGGVRHADPVPVQRAGPACGLLFRQRPPWPAPPRAAHDAVHRHRHQPAPPVRPPGAGKRARHGNEELRQDAAGVGFRGRPPPRPRAGRRRPAVNVTCPACGTLYRVDPAKIPAGGVRARCAVCSSVFAVSASGAEATPPAPSVAAQPAAAGSGAGAAVSAPAAPAPPAVKPQAMPRFSGPGAAPPPPAPPPRAPAAPAAVAGAAPGQRMTGPLRPVNPFMVQDPKQKARRLARALVSDLVVYHPEKRQQGLRDGSLPQLFKDEIEKSWQEYVEQVGPDMAKGTPFWSEALNEILAGGNKIF